MELREAKLFAPLKSWLNKQGYKVYAEVKGIDVIAHMPTKQLAFEMKMTCSEKVIEQALCARGWVDASYVVVPTNPMKEKINKCSKMGIGIIRVAGESIEVLLEPQYHAPFRRINFTGWSEGEVAGIPVLKGSGPAQACVKKIRMYLETSPDADWTEIFNNVPNHYSNPHSLRSSMATHQSFYHYPPRKKTVKSKPIIQNQLILPI